jgi:hypothetical protein
MANHQHIVLGNCLTGLNNEKNEQNKETPEDGEMKQEDWLRIIQEHREELLDQMQKQREEWAHQILDFGAQEGGLGA